MSRSVFDSREGKRLEARRHFLIDTSRMRELTDEERAEQRDVGAQIDLLQFADAIVRGEVAGWIDRERKTAECLRKFLDANKAHRAAIDGGRFAVLQEIASTPTTDDKGGA